MARTSETITNEEGLIYQQWCQKHGVTSDYSNAEVVAEYFQETWQQDVTEANLDTAFPQLKPHLKLYTPLQSEFFKLAARIPEQQAQLILNLISSRGLKDQDDDKLVNFNSIASRLSTSFLSAPPASAHTGGPDGCP